MKRTAVLIILLICTGCGGRASCAGAKADQRIRAVQYNIYKCQRGHEAIVNEIRRMSPDVAFFQEVRVEDWQQLGRELGMSVAFERHKNYPNEGVAIFSRTRLTNVHPVFDPDGRLCALFADTTLPGGRRVTLVSVHLQASQKWTPTALSASDRMRGTEIALVRQAWRDRGSPPVLIGGDFNQLPMGRNYAAMRESFRDALAELNRKDTTLGDGVLRARVDYLLYAGDWRIERGDVAKPGASDHRMIWLDALPPP
jgi:endonuclease/exonuclease/phosphatase (EEP) superfamily protein YafD